MFRFAAPLFVVAGFVSGHLIAADTGVEAAENLSANQIENLGYSGMALLSPDSYLVVHDTKVYEDASRLGVLRLMPKGPPQYEPLTVGDWIDGDGHSNDLESVCSIPGKPREFLTAESGYWKGKYGRIFHIKVKNTTAEVINVFKLPLVADNNENTAGDNFEGIACASLDNERLLIVLGERGGSKMYSNGVLRWGIVDIAKSKVTWPDAGRTGKQIAAPGFWNDPKTKRDISDLYLDSQGTLWASASEDADDIGPFRSVIYKAASVQANRDNPIELDIDRTVTWTLDGLKVEALAQSPDKVGYGAIVFATEDEHLGGIWRPLYPAR